jgi:hypothetical protein
MINPLITIDRGRGPETAILDIEGLRATDNFLGRDFAGVSGDFIYG